MPSVKYTFLESLVIKPEDSLELFWNYKYSNERELIEITLDKAEVNGKAVKFKFESYTVKK